MKHPYFEPIRKLEQEQAQNAPGEATAMSDAARKAAKRSGLIDSDEDEDWNPSK